MNMEDRKTKIFTTAFITGYFIMMIISNYSMISYLTVKRDHIETAIVRDLSVSNSRRSSKGVLTVLLSNGAEVSSYVSPQVINIFQIGSTIKLEVHKNIFQEKFYLEPTYGFLNIWGPTLAYILDSITILFAYLVVSSNKEHKRKQGNVRKMDGEFKLQILIASIIAILISFSFFYVRPI